MKDLFDLNIEQVLEHWNPEHAVREIIANALDEQILTQTQEIEIYKNDGKWHIRDFGRGIQYIHFTQNENKEKLEAPNLIGKFGVGLKDALAVFYRKGIHIEIHSRYCHVTLSMEKKAGFNLETLHASFKETVNSAMKGTDFVITGIKDEAVEIAKSMFLHFNHSASLLEKTRYGEVYSNKGQEAKVYVNGVQVALEDNFLFSYNITNINAQIKKALNRERSNVGRTAYSDTVKRILTSCISEVVLLTLVEDLQNVMGGTNKDESAWIDVATYAAKTLNDRGNVVFMPPYKRDALTNEEVEILKNSDKILILISDAVYWKIHDEIFTFDDVYDEYSDSFNYEFVAYNDLTRSEKEVYNLKEFVVGFLSNHRYKVNVPIAVSETIRVGLFGEQASGVWDEEENAIIIKRSTLRSASEFMGVLSHELAHFHSGYPDNSREFENVLTDMLGIALKEIQKKGTRRRRFDRLFR